MVASRVFGHLSRLLLATALAAAGCSRSAQDSGPVRGDAEDPGWAGPFFRDVTAETGVRVRHRNREEARHFSILESLGGGVGLIDYDGDGLLDLFVVGGGTFEGWDIRGAPCKLFRNLGGFRFQDVTHEVGLDQLGDAAPWFYCHGVAV